MKRYRCEKMLTLCVTLFYRNLLKLCNRVSPQVYDGRISSVQDFMLEVSTPQFSPEGCVPTHSR